MSNWLNITALITSTITSLIRVFWQTGQGYLLPLVLMLLFLAVVLAGLHVVAPLAPFVYSLF